MKQQTKKRLAGFLIFMMLFTMLPAPALAADESTVITITNDNVVTEVNFFTNIIKGTDATSLKEAEWYGGTYPIPSLTSFTEDTVLPGDAVPGFITHNSERYDFAGFILSEYDEATDTLSYSLSPTLTIYAEPAYGTAAWEEWKASVPEGLNAAYMLHTHNYVTKSDDSGHWTECSCEDKTTTEPHTYSSDTDELCDTCGYDLHTHSYTQTQDGDNHWNECSCGDIQDVEKHKFTYTFRDNGYHTVGCEGCHYTNKTSHFEHEIQADANGHWMGCSYCDGKLHFGSHTFDKYDQYCNGIIEYDGDGNVGTTLPCAYNRHASCESDGNPFGPYSITDTTHERTCEDCGLTVREDHTANTYKGIDAAAHAGVCVCGKSLGEAAHTWTQASTHSSYCTECGYWLDNHTYTAFKPSEANPETYHVVYCSVCGEMSDPVQVAGHNYEVKNDKDGHWNLCTDCGYTTAKTAHQMTVSRYDGTSLVHINTCSGCEHDEYENCDFNRGTYAGNEDGHWAVCFACGRTHSGIPLQAHVDENADGTCDVCGESVGQSSPPSGSSGGSGYVYAEPDLDIYTERNDDGTTVTTAEPKAVLRNGTAITTITTTDGNRIVNEVVRKNSDQLVIAPKITQDINSAEISIPSSVIERMNERVNASLVLSTAIADVTVGSTQLSRYSGSLEMKAEKTNNSFAAKVAIGDATIIDTAVKLPAGLAKTNDMKLVVKEHDPSLAPIAGTLGIDLDFDTQNGLQYGIDLGTVTIPADYNHAAIADLAPGKTYNVSGIGANDISVEGLTEVNGTVTQTFRIPDALVDAKNVKYVAVHDTNPYADDLADALRILEVDPGNTIKRSAYEDAKARYDAWEKEHGSGAEFGTVTLSPDGLRLTATYSVKNFSPFIVYAFVEQSTRIVMQIDNSTILAGSERIITDMPPVIVNNRTMVPIRVVTELLGGTADWNAETRTVTLNIDGKVLTLTIGNEIPGYGTPALIMNNRTCVPIRYIAEQSGAHVEWVPATQQIVIEK